MGARTERRRAPGGHVRRVVAADARYRRDYDSRRERPSDTAVALLCVVLIGFLGMCVWLGMLLGDAGGEADAAEVAVEPTEALVRHDSLAPTYTHDGEIIRWYVLVDPDYGIQYLVNDRGGCCVRLDSYGNVMGVSYE